MRADAVYRSEACKKRHERARSRDKAGTDHQLAEARATQEAGALKKRLAALVYGAIIERLKSGPVHADDLEPDFPVAHADVCRSLVGGQFGSLASRHYIFEKERRKSSVPSRKGAKSGVFDFTRTGREKLAGVGSDNREGITSVTADALDRPGGPDSLPADGARSSLAADSGEPSLFEVPPPAPLNPLSDAEAA